MTAADEHPALDLLREATLRAWLPQTLEGDGEVVYLVRLPGDWVDRARALVHGPQGRAAAGGA